MASSTTILEKKMLFVYFKERPFEANICIHIFANFLHIFFGKEMASSLARKLAAEIDSKVIASVSRALR